MEVVDLTIEVSPSTRVFPGSPQPSFIRWSTFGVHGYDSEVMHMSTHTGTHMDAPSHFAPGRASIDQLPAARLVSSAVLVRVPKGADETIGIDDMMGEEIREGDAVVFATGWEKHEGNDYMTRNPGLAQDAARYLVGKKVNAVGIDGPSIDPGFDEKFTAHNILLPAGVVAVENLCNLGMITSKRFTLVAAPLKLSGASGSPVRALALL
ncbi:MAG: cyclase family protein [Nitrososphaera sp.]|uniref:cyclase family protein n=1 Tax=Nitrososphaera sp. TaxID=1971748 RepID=UPI003D6E9FB2